MLHRIRDEFLNDIRSNKFAYLLVSFFIVTGFIAGYISIGRFSEDGIIKIMNSLGAATPADDAAFLLLLLFYIFDTLKYFVCTSLLVLWPVLFPVALLIFMVKGMGFAAFFYTLHFDIGFFNYLWAFPIIVVFFVAEFMIYVVLGKVLTTEAYKNFRLSNIPRTARDRVLNSSEHFRNCAKLFAFALILIIMKSMIMPLIINLS